MKRKTKFISSSEEYQLFHKIHEDCQNTEIRQRYKCSAKKIYIKENKASSYKQVSHVLSKPDNLLQRSS